MSWSKTTCLLVLSLTLGPASMLADEKPYDEAPVPTRTAAPAYPYELKREGVAGMVSVSITVDENGNVISPVVKKSTRLEFEKPALDAVAKWKFKPAKKNGQPVAVKVTIPMKFSIEE